MSVLVNGIRTSQVVISPLLPQTSLSLAFVSSHLGFTLPSSVTIAVDCGPLESLSTHLPCAVSFDQQTAVSLGADWINTVRKWYLDHGFGLPKDGFGLRDLLCPMQLEPVSTPATPAVGAVPKAPLSLSLSPSVFHPPPPHAAGASQARNANPYGAFALHGSEGFALHHHTHAYAPYTNHSQPTHPYRSSSSSSVEPTHNYSTPNLRSHHINNNMSPSKTLPSSVNSRSMRASSSSSGTKHGPISPFASSSGLDVLFTPVQTKLPL
ncbi:hypothetical protein DFH07DRAFT_962033 [Mycena maculata]|uniref:Uncharacterized protein n=1 Tax=Mycena maculata TaxID=230809 RepID=A0AAD7IT43_9AGAR|nr:hypothetical protein DFH07DRAFT_962033 [Mycena maculata]